MNTELFNLEEMMKKILGKIMLVTLTVILAFAVLVPAQTQSLAIASDDYRQVKTPKYIFFFIGDGMTYPQITSAADYLGALKKDGVQQSRLSFMDFPVSGSSETFDSTSFCPDSASTATSLSTGNKTLSGVLNMNEEKTVAYETIAEQLKKQLGYKIGIVSSVPINHATPAAYYAHQPSRSKYYEIGLELIDSGFDYFAGGGLIAQKGRKGDRKDLITCAREKGFIVPQSKQQIRQLKPSTVPILAINPELSGLAFPYEIDRKEDELSLADFTRKGIDVLKNDKGFFMMVEGGKIDWACHANDAATSIHDTIAFDQAVKEALSFYYQYPDDTLIVVTGDHETGGMTIGFSGTGYSTYLPQLSLQKMSYEAFDEHIDSFRADHVAFEEVLPIIEENFGLIAPQNAQYGSNKNLILSDYEFQLLHDAYNMSMIDPSIRSLTQKDKLSYGYYEPFSVTITHLLNNKSGIGWTSYSHTGLPTAVYAIGQGAEFFAGNYDNTKVYEKLKGIAHIK